ncbi:helix-turn-helix domain-containing protein [Nocardia pseudobrasiliensis]|uniref:Helix-turn-helix protein n=1 Tax=Nocardia pseudobrasiliensis TaxID=45979 RepID=A0A370HPD4_9NOCA|nr:helix-turn-helix transcriptional regulator [Nocardia pseudobrasiliensis]RDI60433.1 helix-turn-helix protein [Nocardia pseudobrasiliensis]
MTPKVVSGGPEFGSSLRRRREALGLTIEEAARAASVGSETWRRYEAGSSVRRDKVRGICVALRWRSLPESGESTGDSDERWEDFPKAKFDDSYSAWLEREFGESRARLFASGCDIFRDQLSDELSRLGKQPRGTHLGELDVSWLEGSLPAQWLPRYDYDFVFRLHCTVEGLRQRVVRAEGGGMECVTRSVAEDLALHLILERGMVSAEAAGSSAAEDWDEWEYELNGEDDEVIPALFSKSSYVEQGSRLHFDRWFEVVDYVSADEADEPA